MNLQISIYIPAFNAESTIKLCINSILTQTVRPLEILVINDASTDNTQNILLEFGNKINVIKNPTNLGLSHSMNITNNHLKTKFIAKIDADVELCSDWIELLMKKMVNTKVTKVYGWKPKNSIYDVVSDTYRWLNTNKLILKEYL